MKEKGVSTSLSQVQDAWMTDATHDQYAFRFNPRTARAGGLLFHRLVEQAVPGYGPIRSPTGGLWRVDRARQHAIYVSGERSGYPPERI